MKIAVIGAGAIGGVVGGLLARAGEDVVLIGRKAQVDSINNHGLIIDGALGELHIQVKATDHLDFEPDVVLLSVKTQDVEVAAREIKPYVSGVPVVTMQNGIRSDDLVANVLEKRNVISCVVFFGSTFLEPGRVTYLRKGAMSVGDPFGSNGKRVKDIAAVLDKAVPTHIARDIRGVHWTKLIMNLNNAIPAVTGYSMQEVGGNRWLRQLAVTLMKEGMRVVQRSGVTLRSLPSLPVWSLKLVAGLPLPAASMFFGLTVRSMGKLAVLGSTLQSIQRGKSTEIDFLNGEIVNLGKKLGIATPCNASIVDLVHQVEETGKFLSAEEFVAAVEAKRGN